MLFDLFLATLNICPHIRNIRPSLPHLFPFDLFPSLVIKSKIMQITMPTNASLLTTVEEKHIPTLRLDLQANKGKLTSLLISGLFIRVLIPAFFLHILLIKGLAWEGLAYWAAFIPLMGLSSWMLYQKIKGKQKEQKDLSLSITNDMLILSWQKESLHEIPLTEIQVEELGWGPDVDSLLPAIRLHAADISSLTIGTMEASAYWTDYRRSVECVDFLVGDEKSWNQLMAWIMK